MKKIVEVKIDDVNKFIELFIDYLNHQEDELAAEKHHIKYEFANKLSRYDREVYTFIGVLEVFCIHQYTEKREYGLKEIEHLASACNVKLV